MKQILLPLFLICAAVAAVAQPVGHSQARNAAQQFLAIYEPELAKVGIHSTPAAFYYDSDWRTVFYVFNIGDRGFILAGADRSFAPVVGYSANGTFDTQRLPDNLKVWLQNYVEDVCAIKASATKSQEISRQQTAFRAEWEALERGYSTAKGTKAVNALVETHWDQGTGYNNYCPPYNGGHSVTGCVATAMAQIIRYHRYPTTGFYHSSYTHSTYGRLSAQYDSVVYDYSQMPESVNGYSNSAQQNAVSLLCYHCGIAVKMNYQNPSHTSGSGAHSEDVPVALRFFGYANSFYLNKNGIPSTTWDSLLRHDLDASRPVYYSGSNSEGGHAFVCDGYRNNGTYHFNFGWSGYGDGYYSLTSVNGYSSAQGAVFNIVPSHLGPMRDTLYFAPDGTGDASSWNSASPSPEMALEIYSLYKRGQMWLKSGTYYGNTSADYAFTMGYGISLYGGFAGNETSLDQRDPQGAPTVLSGNGQHGVLYSPTNVVNAALYDVVLTGGITTTDAPIYADNNIRLERCTIEDNHAEEGSAVASFNNCRVYCCIFHNNHGAAIDISNGYIKNCMIAHNDGYGITASGGSIDGSDIVCNKGTGIDNNKVKIRNCVVWRNDSSLTDNNIGNITFSAIEGFGEKDSNSNFGLSHYNRPDEGIGPIFMDPDTTIGIAPALGDWQPSNRSPLTDAGDTSRTGSYGIDLAGFSRYRNGRADIGCYEHDPYVGIETPADNVKVRVFPNPASNTVWVESTTSELLEIYDTMGRRVTGTKITDGRTAVDVSALPQGVYVLRTANTTSKFIKK